MNHDFRLPGFVVMALLLWSPVLVPLLPTLLQQWANRSYNGIASMAALVGLYGAVVILVAIWGRKIRGYNDPLVEYGIKLQPTLRQVRHLSKL
jgi:membrane protease YdiL (CAAX protease family)